VLRSGARNTVFVALDGGRFEPRVVELGPRSENDRYQVLAGLAEGERVVTSGQFMLDSESQLREAIQKMVEPPPLAGARTQTAPARAPNAQPPAAPAFVAYVCPMPEHVSIQFAHPGLCPLCGMKLVPVTADELAHLVPGAAVDYYTCPMPEHADVHLDRPGQCPKCGMTLIPVMKAPEPKTPTAEPAGLPVLFTCPMASHADVVSDKPGQCPKCGMDLVPTSTVAHGKTAEASWRKQHAPAQQL